MENHILSLAFIGGGALLLVPMITIAFNLVFSHYKYKVISINNRIKIYSNNLCEISKLKEQKHTYLEKIRKACRYKFYLKVGIGLIGIFFTAIYLYKQVIQIELFGNINPLNELIEVLKNNSIDSDKLSKIQGKINTISYQEKPSLGMYIFGQVLLSSFALNDICGTGNFPSDEFRSIEDKIERQSRI